MQYLSRFDTVQSFWTKFQEYPPVSLADKSYLHIFKDGVAPLWEDPQNVNGGHFKLTAVASEGSLAMWQSIVLHMIGEQFPNNTCINGASIVVHGIGNNLVKVWLTTTDRDTVARTKAFLMSILNPEDYITGKVTFVPHKLVLPNVNQQKSLNSSQTLVVNIGTQEDSKPRHRGQKRRKSRDLGLTPDVKKGSIRRSSLVTSINAPVCCGPAEVRFAHDPYSTNGGCTYLPLK